MNNRVILNLGAGGPPDHSRSGPRGNLSIPAIGDPSRRPERFYLVALIGHLESQRGEWLSRRFSPSDAARAACRPPGQYPAARPRDRCRAIAPLSPLLQRGEQGKRQLCPPFDRVGILFSCSTRSGLRRSAPDRPGEVSQPGLAARVTRADRRSVPLRGYPSRRATADPIRSNASSSFSMLLAKHIRRCWSLCIPNAEPGRVATPTASRR